MNIHSEDIFTFNDNITTYPFIDLGGSTRIYYWPASKTDKLGFDFVVHEWMQGNPREDNSFDWTVGSTETKVLYTGHAAFDGIRHLYSGDNDQPGYIYYPNTLKQIQIFQELEKLERKYCAETDYF